VTTIGQEIVPKRLELAKETIPGLTRIGVLWDPESKASTNSLAQAQDAAKVLKLQLEIVEARSPADFDKAFRTLAKARIRVFVLMSAGMFGVNRQQLLESAVRHRLIGVFTTGEFVDGGAPLAYGADFFESQRHAAAYVDKILKGGKPAELPIEQATKSELVVNLKTARTLGIKIPQSILVRADRVIE
jgi:putative ABC transport system substrate-binding protein